MWTKADRAQQDTSLKRMRSMRIVGYVALAWHLRVGGTLASGLVYRRKASGFSMQRAGICQRVGRVDRTDARWMANESMKTRTLAERLRRLG